MNIYFILANESDKSRFHYGDFVDSGGYELIRAKATNCGQ